MSQLDLTRVVEEAIKQASKEIIVTWVLKRVDLCEEEIVVMLNNGQEIL